MTDTNLSATQIHDGWTLTHTGGEVPQNVQGITIPAVVPGSNHLDLLAAGLIPDPYLDQNEKALEWMWRTDWSYQTTFDATALAEGERAHLEFDGLDTIATVSLNDTVVGSTQSMHRSYRFDVTELLNENNSLTVNFASALGHAEEVEKIVGVYPRPYPHPYHAIRKMACSFGWDWGPDLQTAGIWKPVRLVRWSTARLDSVRPLITVDGTTGKVEAHVSVLRADNEAALAVTVEVAGASTRVEIPAGETSVVVILDVPNVERWWPVGYGEAKLYELNVTLLSGDVALDSYQRKVGFRTARVEFPVDEQGTGMVFVVNDRNILIKGANWIPDDHFLTRITRESLLQRFNQALDANMNLLRIWGGGIYETEEFYNLANELGLLVWQDFLFACSGYSEKEPIRSEVIAEAREAVTRLAPHPSLVFYNGSNENFQGYKEWGWELFLGERAWGEGYYNDILPGIVAELDPTRSYGPSSPFSPGKSIHEVSPNDPRWGSVHEWEVWNRQDYSTYRNYVPRFGAEFGYQGPANWATLVRSLPEEGFNQEHPAWLLHQKAESGNDKLNRGMEPHLPGTDNFEAWHWATQLNQAHAIRYGIEHMRSHWPTCTGTILWQLNDCWPVTSWAAIDGDRRLKPLWYTLKHVYEPRLLTFQPRDGVVTLVALNDTDEAWDETLTFSRVSVDGDELAVATAHLAVGPRAQAEITVPAHVLEAADVTAEVLVADAGYPGDDEHVRAVWTFAEEKEINYEEAPYTVIVSRFAGGYEVTVSATGVVRDLTLLADKVASDAIVNDALITLLADEEFTFVVTTSEEVNEDRFSEANVLVSVNSLTNSTIR